MRKLVVIIFLLTTFLFSSCRETEASDIYTTIYPVEFLAKEIVKNEMSVSAVYPKGQDIHEYELTTDNVLKMKNGKAIFYIGLGLEPAIDELKTSTFKECNLISLSQNITLVSASSNSDDTDYNFDEHIWLDPQNMIIMGKTVLDEVIKLKPEKEEFFKENYNILKNKLQELDNKYMEALSDSSIKNKVIMVDHDAYAYWTSRYGIERIKLRSNNDTGEVTMTELLEKIEMAKEKGIKYIIATKNEAKCKMFNNYLDKLNAQEVSLHHLGTQTKQEAEGLEGDEFIDYFSIMEYNLEVLKKVLPRN